MPRKNDSSLVRTVFGELQRVPEGKIPARGRVATGAYPPERTDNASEAPPGLPERLLCIAVPEYRHLFRGETGRFNNQVDG